MAASDPRAIVLLLRAIQLCNVAVFAFHLCSCLSNAWSVSGNFAFAESGRCDFETPSPDRNLHGHALAAQIRAIHDAAPNFRKIRQKF